MVTLALATRFEDLLVIRLDKHVPELADLCVAQDAYGRFDAVERYVAQRTADAEAPMVISGRSSQGRENYASRGRTATTQVRISPGFAVWPFGGPGFGVDWV